MMENNSHIDNISIENIEYLLRETLTPTTPRSGFVLDLKEKLFKTYSKTNRRKQVMKYGVFGTAGFLGSLVVIVTSIRVVITLLGAVRVVRQVNVNM